MTVTQREDVAIDCKLADAEALAARLGVSERSIQRLAKQGKIPHYRVGRQLRFDVAEALAALRGANAR